MKEIKFVDVGEGITEGHVLKWMVKDGGKVKEDQAIVQVETDKAVVNVPAPIDGVVKIAAPEGTTLHVGDTVAWVGEPGELANVSQSRSAEAQQPKQQQKQPVQQQKKEEQKAPAPQQAKDIIATPSVRKLALGLKVNLAEVTGTGPNGRILENDVRGMANKGAAPGEKKVAPKFSEALEEQHQGEIERVPMSMTRKAIAKNMEASWTIPRAVHMDLIDATTLYGIVEEAKGKMLKQFDTKLTFLPFIIKAVIEALKEIPNFNASYDHEKLEIIRKRYYNIGLAAETDDGLKVIVVKDADQKSILEIAKEIHELSEKLKSQTITVDEMKDSSFTITNIGSLGGGYLSVPMINYPDVAILGVHLIRDRPMVKDGKIVIGKELPFSISFDHRVVDGAEAVKFGNAIIRYLQDPDFLEMLG